MVSRTAFLSKLIGFYIGFFALAMLTQKQAMIATVTAIVHNPSTLLVCAMLGMTAGLAIVLSHNLWRGGAPAIAVTVTGWLALIKGLIFLLLPPVGQVSFFEALHFDKFFNFYLGFMVVFSLYLIIAGFSLGRRLESRVSSAEALSH